MAFAATMTMLAASLSGCAGFGDAAPTTEAAAQPSTACDTFRALSWHKSDTRDTVRGIQGHNAAGRAICPAEHPNWRPPAPKPKAQPKPAPKPATVWPPPPPPLSEPET